MPGSPGTGLAGYQGLNWLNMPITNGYLTKQVPGNGDSPHYAVDVATPYHTIIGAPWAGTVQSARTGLPWGTEVFIKPDDPNMPVYYFYHLDHLYVQKGDRVSVGTPVGLSGGQNSGGENPSTPAMSGGPHTHVGFFTAFTSTPIGNRPYGPDITPALTALKNGKTYNGNTVGQSAQNANNALKATPSFSLPDLSGIGIHIGLFVLALVLVIFGGYLLLRPQLDEGAKDVAKGAVLA
jgi:murein DD-endopeptidase MepM/ murein hydrolase activator NlpD